MKGLTKGAKESRVAIVGGETAIIPELLSQKEENSFDLVGSVFGIADKKSLVMGNKITGGDIIIGLESNGLHSNGYSLARKVLLPRYKLKNSTFQRGFGYYTNGYPLGTVMKIDIQSHTVLITEHDY